MPVFGIDVSDFQAGLVPVVADGRLKRQGFEFIIPKCTEGSTFAASTYPKFIAAAKSAGMLVAAYHFLHHGNADAQAQNYVNHCGDKSIPVMIDLEADGATLADANAFRDAVHKLGVTHCLLYLPNWYWSGHIGRPDLSGWDGRLVSSAYPSTRHDYASNLYNGQGNGVGWQPYGGVKPTIWQFADSTKIDGYTGNVDGDVFAGTLDELRTQVPFKDFGSKPAPTPAPKPTPSPKPAPKPQPAPKPSGQELRIIGWNCYVANQDAAVEATLNKWIEQYDPDAFCLSEARTHARVLHGIDGYRVLQERPGADLPGGIINDDGDSAILLRNDHAKNLVSDHVVKMYKRWKVVDPKHPHTHTPRHYQVVKFKVGRKIVRLRASHWPTHGFAGANHLAVVESAVRSKAWLLAGLLSPSLDVGDLNDTLAAITKWFRDGFKVVGARNDDVLVGRAVKDAKATQLDMGGSDHHGQLYTVHL